VTRVPVIVGTGLQLPPAPGIPGGRPASPLDEPPLPSEEPPSLPPPLLPDELAPPDEGLLPEDEELPLEVEAALDELLPDAAPLLEGDPLPEEPVPELDPLPDVEPPPDDELLEGEPVPEEPHAAPSTRPVAARSGAASSALTLLRSRVPVWLAPSWGLCAQDSADILGCAARCGVRAAGSRLAVQPAAFVVSRTFGMKYTVSACQPDRTRGSSAIGH
jgi:hypothetical protein